MILKFDQLDDHLQGNLKPIYWLHGDIPLFLDESLIKISAAAKQAGFQERVAHLPENDDDWTALRLDLMQQGLFTQKRLCIIRLIKSTITKPYQIILESLAENYSKDTCLVIVSPRLDRKLTSAPAYKMIAKIGATLPIWPPTTYQFQKWLTTRLLKSGLKTDAKGIKQLVGLTEGNMTAAAQSIELMALNCGAGFVSADQIMEINSAVARHDLNSFNNQLIQAEPESALRTFQALVTDKQPPTLLLWSLHQHLCRLGEIARTQAAGLNPMDALDKTRLWDTQKRKLIGTASALGIKQIHHYIAACTHIDHQIKHSDNRQSLLNLSALTLAACGAQIPSALILNQQS